MSFQVHFLLNVLHALDLSWFLMFLQILEHPAPIIAEHDGNFINGSISSSATFNAIA